MTPKNTDIEKGIGDSHLLQNIPFLPRGAAAFRRVIVLQADPRCPRALTKEMLSKLESWAVETLAKRHDPGREPDWT